MSTCHHGGGNRSFLLLTAHSTPHHRVKRFVNQNLNLNQNQNPTGLMQSTALSRFDSAPIQNPCCEYTAYLLVASVIIRAFVLLAFHLADPGRLLKVRVYVTANAQDQSFTSYSMHPNRLAQLMRACIGWQKAYLLASAQFESAAH